MRDVFRSGAVKLPTFTILAVVAGSMVAPPICAQVAAQASTRARRDTTFMYRLVPPGEIERLLKARLDSLRVALDREPISSADRDSLRKQSQRLVNMLSQLSRVSAEFTARVATEMGTSAGTVVVGKWTDGGMRGASREFRIAMPRGWIGIVAEAPHDHRIIGDNEIIRYLDYPSIVSVDRNSPAARAGINAGDVLIAYDRADVRDHEINLSRLLVPDRRLSVTVRRDGEIKEYEMTVARASAGFIRQRTEVTSALMDSVARSGRLEVVIPEERSLPRSPKVAGGMVAAGAMPTRVFLTRPGLSSGTLWGAQLSTISSGLGRTLGVSTGVLVLTVLPATPADRSGLDDGDIIVKVDGQPVTSVEMLWKASAERDAERELDLEVLRARKPLKLTLRWAK